MALLAGRTTAQRSEIGQYGAKHRDTGQHQEHRSYAAERPDQHAGQECAGACPMTAIARAVALTPACSRSGTICWRSASRFDEHHRGSGAQPHHVAIGPGPRHLTLCRNCATRPTPRGIWCLMPYKLQLLPSTPAKSSPWIGTSPDSPLYDTSGCQRRERGRWR